MYLLLPGINLVQMVGVGCKLCDFELNINAFSGLLFCYLENKGAKLVDRFPPPLNTYDINCKSFSFFF